MPEPGDGVVEGEAAASLRAGSTHEVGITLTARSAPPMLAMGKHQWGDRHYSAGNSRVEAAPR